MWACELKLGTQRTNTFLPGENKNLKADIIRFLSHTYSKIAMGYFYVYNVNV